MTIIKPNSIAGVTSITAQGDVINVYKSDGTLAGLQLNGVNFNTTAGISTFNNLTIGAERGIRTLGSIATTHAFQAC